MRVLRFAFSWKGFDPSFQPVSQSEESPHFRRCTTKVLGFIWLLLAGQLNAQTLTMEFVDAGYTLSDLGSAAGVPANYGGLTIRPEQPDVIHLGGAANRSNGAIYIVPIVRDSTTNRIIALDTAQFYREAPNVDGGVVFTPESTLLFTRYSNNAIGQILPDSTFINTPLGGFGVASSVGSCAIVPDGYAGAGNLIISSYNSSQIYQLPYSVNTAGEYSFSNSLSSVSVATEANGPEGIAYVPKGSMGFESVSMLISAYDAGKIVAFEADSNGLPLANTGRDMVTGLSGAEGAAIDPVTGDFLFSTFGGGNRIILVSGFSTPTRVDLEAGKLKNFTLSPNPAPGAFTLSSPQAAIESVALYDLTGRALSAEVSLQRHEAQVRSDYRGLVVVKVLTERGSWVGKVRME